MTQVPSVRFVGVAALLGVAALAAVPLYRVPVYKVPWARAKGRKLPSLPNEETGPGQADNGGPDNDGRCRGDPTSGASAPDASEGLTSPLRIPWGPIF